MKNLVLNCKAMLIIAVICCSSTFGYSQIMSDALYTKTLEKKYPGIEKAIRNTYKEALEQTSARNSTVYRIPVVFHVLYNNDQQNFSDELIHDQLEVLNNDFRRMNADAGNTRDIFADVAADTEIEFYLAEKDPTGNPTSGITRTSTDKASFIELDINLILEAIFECGLDTNDPEVAACIEEALANLEIDLDLMKNETTGGISPWNTDQYLNIWCCNLAVDFMGTESPFLLGYAYPPVGAPNWPDGSNPGANVDGVVLHYQTVGRNHPNIGALAGLADQGRTCVHEVGHYLGLRHIWGDGDCSMDDGLNDTPAAGANSQPTEAPFPTCDELHLKDSCEEDNLPDMIENYMDYSIESCQNMFTADQVAIMRAMLEGPRNGLLANQMSATIDLDNFLKTNVTPNPTMDYIRVSFDDNTIFDFNYQIIDLSGKRILAGQNTKTIDLKQLIEGNYLLKIEAGNKSIVKKIVKLNH